MNANGLKLLEGKYTVTMDLWPLQGTGFTRIQPFWDHLREGRLTSTRCRTCGSEGFPPRVVCPECMGDDLEWFDLPTEGTVQQFTEEHIGVPLGFETPLVHALVNLGPWTLFVRVQTRPDRRIAVGSRVRLKPFEVEPLRAEIGRDSVEIPRVHYCFEEV